MAPHIKKSKDDHVIPKDLKEKKEDSELDVKSKKECAAPVKWDDNKQWTHRAIDYLLENTSFRLKLFSDSTSSAKEEKCRKVQNGEGKGILYGELALHIFSTDPNRDVHAAYKADPHKYSRSTQMQFQR
jgi:hypothetical protein